MLEEREKLAHASRLHESELADARAESDAALAEQHPDDIAVDKFAAAMKAKMAKQRAKGYGGWDEKLECEADHLQHLLVSHIAKGDPVDVGNFAMMLFNRGESTAPQPDRKSLTDDDIRRAQ